MNNTKKPVFNADAAEEYFSDLLVYYRNTANDIFNRDNDGRHASNHIYSAEYQKYVGMQIAMREVLEYFSKYDLVDVHDILGDNYDLDRIREIVDADRDGLCVVLPCKPGDILRHKGHDCEADHWNIVLTAFSKSEYTKSGKNIHLLSVQEAAEAVLEGRYQNEDC